MVTTRAALRLTAFRLSDLDLAILAEVQRREGLVTAASAFRHLLRRYAKDEGISLDSLTPAPPATTEAPASKAVAKASPGASAKPKRRSAKG